MSFADPAYGVGELTGVAAIKRQARNILTKIRNIRTCAALVTTPHCNKVVRILTKTNPLHAEISPSKAE
jgi:hypothetical protein